MKAVFTNGQRLPLSNVYYEAEKQYIHGTLTKCNGFIIGLEVGGKVFDLSKQSLGRSEGIARLDGASGKTILDGSMIDQIQFHFHLEHGLEPPPPPSSPSSQNSYNRSPLGEVRALMAAVDEFAEEMKAKLVYKAIDGGERGWDCKTSLPNIWRRLRDGVATDKEIKAVDFANLAMMIWWNAIREKAKSNQ